MGQSRTNAGLHRYVNGKCQEEKQNMIVTVVDCKFQSFALSPVFYRMFEMAANFCPTCLADSHLSTSYFESIIEMHRQYPQTAACTLYVPPIIFDRNAHLVPSLVRVADILWLGAGMSGHTSSICPPTSVYSLSLALVDRVGGWDAGGDAIGEDLVRSLFVRPSLKTANLS